MSKNFQHSLSPWTLFQLKSLMSAHVIHWVQVLKNDLVVVLKKWLELQSLTINWPRYLSNPSPPPSFCSLSMYISLWYMLISMNMHVHDRETLSLDWCKLDKFNVHFYPNLMLNFVHHLIITCTSEKHWLYLFDLYSNAHNVRQ